MAQFPTGTYIFSDAVTPSGWNNQASLGGRYVLGATSPSQLKTLGGASSHKHGSASLSSVAGHNHGGQHAVTSSAPMSSGTSFGGTGATTAAGNHVHTVTITISNNLSHAHSVGESSSADNDIPHTTLMLLRKS